MAGVERSMDGRTDDHGEARTAGRKEWLGLAVLVLAVVLLAVDATVLSLAVPSLAEDLDPSATQLLWIVDVYSFALAGLLVTMGNLGDRIGRKRLLLIGAAGFGAASLLAAIAPTAAWLIAARALLGVAGATLMPSTLSLIRTMFPDARQRTTAIAVWGGAATAGAAAGPLVGGALLQHFWWGSVFVINLPVMVLLLVTGAWLLPESRSPQSAPLDVLGAVLSVATIIPAVYAIKLLASEGLDVTVVVAAAFATVCGSLFVARQRRAAAPLLDLGLFRSKAFSGAVAANVLAIFALSGLLFYLSQYLQLVRGLRPLAAGVAQSPMTLASLFTAFLAGWLVARLGRGRVIGAGLACAAAGVATVAAAEVVPGYGWLAAGLAVTGFGVGLALTVTTDAVVSAVPAERAGAAAAVSETGYELGAALGIALLGSLHTALYRGHLTLPTGLADDLAERARESIASAMTAASDASASLREPIVTASREAFVTAMQMTSAVTAALLVAAAVVSWRLIPAATPPPLDRQDPVRPSETATGRIRLSALRAAAGRTAAAIARPVVGADVGGMLEASVTGVKIAQARHFDRAGTRAAAARGEPAALAAFVDRRTATRHDWVHAEMLAVKSPRPGSALTALTAVWAQRRQWDDAERLAREAARHNAPTALTMTALALAGAQRWTDARRLAAEAVRHGDRDAIVHLAEVCEVAGETDLLLELTTTTMLARPQSDDREDLNDDR
ncbi:MFS transporter [Mycobacterium sp. CPCC 205372]|uniref:MFS transporter n=1 Tax=Mycobacterium hippophais TaxID=3016340 RepID=A0ABT4PTV3_9MYCO|nr:MFS transporter [Mycobacterium hippophais]MCZ8379980.1 MFS transporter [Mycobacterium hippophais]